MIQQGVDLSRYMRHGAVVSNGSDDWRTPKIIFDALDREYAFTRDAAATRENSHCKLYWDIQDDALQMDWSLEKSIFCNPPYSKVAEFLAKAHEPETAVFLIPFRPQTGFFLRYIWASPYLHEVKIIHRGIRFIHPDRVESVRSPMPCCILVYHKVKRDRDLYITVNCADSLSLLQVVAGRKPGRPLSHSYSVKDKIIQDYLRGEDIPELVERYKVARSTVYRWIKNV